MSLVIASVCSDGILIASDTFVFDNSEVRPSKKICFDRIYSNETLEFALAGVGSRWVFNETIEWIDKNQSIAQNIESIRDVWVANSKNWFEKRSKEIESTGESTLRPLSNSMCILADQNNLDRIQIIDSSGKIASTKTYVILGSGIDIAVRYLSKSERTLGPDMSLLESCELLLDTFEVASSDLYVIGIPVIATLTNARISNFADSFKRIEDNLDSDRSTQQLHVLNCATYKGKGGRY